MAGASEVGTAGVDAPRARLSRNAIQNFFALTIPLLIAVLAVPVVVRGLGPERFGILALVWVVVNYIGELGFGRATTRYVALALARGDGRLLADATWMTLLIQLGIGILIGLLLGLGTPVLVSRVLEVSPGLVGEAYRSCLLLALSLPLIATSGAIRGVLEASQRFDLVNVVRLPSSLATYLVPLVGVWLGWSLTLMVALLMAVRLTMVVIYLGMSVRLFPGLRARPRFAVAVLRGVVGYGGWVTTSSLISPVLVYVERILLGALVGVAAVGYYSGPYELVTRMWVVPASIMATLFPAFNALGDQRDWAEVGRLTAHSVRALLVVLGPLALVLAVGADDILGLWLGPEFAHESAWALRILAVGVLVNSLAQAPFTLLQGLGRADLTAKIHLLELPGYLVLAWMLVARYGITGAALAWTIRVTVDAVAIVVALRVVSPFRLREVAEGWLGWGLAILLGSGLLLLWLNAQIPGAWVRLGVLAVGGAGVMGALLRQWLGWGEIMAVVGASSGRGAAGGALAAAPAVAQAGASTAARGMPTNGVPGEPGKEGPAEAPVRKVLIIGPTPPPYHGMSIYTRQLINSPVLLASYGVVHLDTADRRSLSNLGRLDLINVWLALRHSAELAWSIVRERPELVYVEVSQNALAYLRDAVFIVIGKALGCRVVTHLHGSEFRDFYERSGALVRVLVRTTSRLLDGAAVLSPGLRGIYRGLVPEDRVHVVPAGVADPFPEGEAAAAGEGAGADEAEVSRGGEARPIQVTYLGMLNEAKGVLELIRAASLLEDLELRFVCAGEWYSDAEREKAERVLREHRLEGRIEFPGRVDGEEKDALWRATDIFVFPGIQPEGLPLVILEAMAAAVPVIATDTGAVRDAVKPGEGGLIVEKGDPSGLAAAIRRLATDPVERRRLGLGGRSRFLENYTEDRATERLVAFLDAVSRGR